MRITERVPANKSSGRVEEPVKGLWDSIPTEPSKAPDNWAFVDGPVTKESTGSSRSGPT